MPAFEGFKQVTFPISSDLVQGEIHAKVGGSGPGLLLLHGYPQTHKYVHLNCVRPLEFVLLKSNEIPIDRGSRIRAPFATRDWNGTESWARS